MADSDTTSAIDTSTAELLSDNMETKILSILRDTYPNLDCGPGTPMYEMVVRPIAMLWQRQNDGIASLLEAINLSNYATMPEVDLDNLLGRYFITRRKGKYVTGVIRVYFAEPTSITMATGDIVSASNGRVYEILSDKYLTPEQLNIDENGDYFIDVGVQSLSTGNQYNADANESVTVTGASSNFISRAYFLTATTDGGVSESNAEFFARAKSEIANRNLFAYRSVRAMLYDAFDDIKEVIPIGIRDPEMVRDIYSIPNHGDIHLGGKCDLYIHPYSFTMSDIYNPPLGFPLSFQGHTLADDPAALLTAWNGSGYFVAPEDRALRGSQDEKITNLEAGSSDQLVSLTYDLSDITTYVNNSTNSSLHTDNLVKLVYPIVFTATIKINTKSAETVAQVKSLVVQYINNLESTQYPRVSDLINLVMMGSNAVVRISTSDRIMDMRAYYLNEYAEMEYIGLDLERSSSRTLFIPQEKDSLRFILDDMSQLSLKTCCWYTNEDLIKVEVIS